MKKLFFVFGIIFVGIIFICLTYGEKLQEVKNPDQLVLPPKVNHKAEVKPDINFGKIPLYFITNKGQVNKQAKFYAKTSRYTLWLTKEGLIFDGIKRKENTKSEFRDPKQIQNIKFEIPKQKIKNNSKEKSSTFQRDVSRLMFINANKNSEILPLIETKLKVNYFKGNDPSRWVGNIPTSQAVLYKNLYKNIDLKVYGIEKQIEYDWIVRPGSNPEDIRFEYKNVKYTQIDKDGNLVITTKFGKLFHKKPVSYQQVHLEADNRACPSGTETENKKPVNVTFKKVGENTYGFEVGDYDKGQILIIDPLVLVYSSYLGGNNADYSYSIAVDSSGYVYVTGDTYSTDFPILNQYMNVPGGSHNDVFVTKIDPTQSGSSSLLYSTYLGGGNSDQGQGIAVDSSGYAYVTGFTYSTDFPTLNQYQGAQSGWDSFITKLDTTQSGTASLLYSTYLGGNDWDYGYDIDVDSSGYAYITGFTYSTDFPTLNQYQADQGGIDVFVTKLDTTQSGSACLLYSTYLGGGSDDRGYGIAVDNSDNAYVTGDTFSTDFPILNQYQADQGGIDVFVTKLDTTQSGTASLLYSTYLGGLSRDRGTDIAVDSSGYVYVTGDTVSTDFPILNQYQADPGDSYYDVFVTKLDTTQSGTASLLYSTYLGGGFDDTGYGITVDSSGYVYVTGFTRSTDFPILNQYQADPGDNDYDAFITRLDVTKSGTASLLYSTYLGGGATDWGRSIAVDSSGYVYVAGYTDSTDFPTRNQYQTDPGDGNNDPFVTKLTVSTLKVTSPNGGEDWTLNTTRYITWQATRLTNVIYIILEQNGVNVALIDKGINPALETYTWTVGECRLGSVVAGVNYKILLKEKDSPVKDKSDAVFTISNPHITVIYPDGGEKFQIGTTENITWETAGITGTLYIVLRRNETNVALIAKNVNPDLGSYSWKVGDCLKGAVTPGSNYKILIVQKGPVIKDKSDGAFVVNE